jgi:CheY-like chemotaxis protein
MSRILLIDDDVETTEALVAALRILGHEAVWAHDAKEGDTCLRSSPPDVAIVDMNLPGVSGLNWIARQAEAGSPVYSCLATGAADYKLLERAVRAGASTMLGKPYGLADLVSVIQTATHLQYSIAMADVAEDSPFDPLKLRSENRLGLDRSVASVIRYVQNKGADHDTAGRIIPLIAYELITNTQRHGSGNWTLTCSPKKAELILQITDDGSSFPWQRELAQKRSNWDRSKATGLQLVTALATDFSYDNDGRTACVTVPKVSVVHQASTANSMAEL